MLTFVRAKKGNSSSPEKLGSAPIDEYIDEVRTDLRRNILATIRLNAFLSDTREHQVMCRGSLTADAVETRTKI